MKWIVPIDPWKELYFYIAESLKLNLVVELDLFMAVATKFMFFGSVTHVVLKNHDVLG